MLDNSRASDLTRRAAAFLASCGVPEPEKEAELLMVEGLGMDRVLLYRDDPVVNGDAIGKLRGLLKRRAAREPMQYIIGHVLFYDLVISVGPGVLVPRPETELLVETALRLIGKDNPCDVLDMFTGSGAIALAIAANRPKARVMGTDVSGDALRYAELSSKRNGIGNAVFLKGHMFDPAVGRKFHLITANPPYVPEGDIAALAPEVRDWEPQGALAGGPEGLDYYKALFIGAGGYLHPQGRVVVEIGIGQAGDVARIAEAGGFSLVEKLRDYAGIHRVLMFARAKD